MPKEPELGLPAGFDDKPLARLVKRVENLARDIEETEAFGVALEEKLPAMREATDPRDELAVQSLQFEERKLELVPGCIRSANEKLDGVREKIEAQRPKIEAAIRQIYGDAVTKLKPQAIEAFLPWYGSEELARAAADKCPVISAMAARPERMARSMDHVDFAKAALSLFEKWRKNGGELPRD